MAENTMHELNAQFNDMGLKPKNKKRSNKMKNNKMKDCSKNGKSKICETEAQSMLYQTLEERQDIKYICALCGGNLYADLIQENASEGTMHYKLICPRGCEEPPKDHIDNEQLNIKPLGEAAYSPNSQQHPMRPLTENVHMPMDDGYLRRYNPYQQQDMHAILNNQYGFNPTPDHTYARAASLNNGYVRRSYNPYQRQNMVPMLNNQCKLHTTPELKNARATCLKQLLKTVDCDNCYRMTAKERANRFEKFKSKNVRHAEYQLSSGKNCSEDAASSTPDYNPDLSSMAEHMFQCSERLRRFYQQAQNIQGCEKCGGM